MRPVNLIPQDQRRGERGRSRTGRAPYLLLGALGLVLAGVIALVHTSGQIEEREAEATALEQRERAATARTDALRPYVDFATLAAFREQTVNQLADSRFDWERVLHELALVLPSDVWLTELTGTVSPAVQVQGSTGVGPRAEVAGPALELLGCAASQDGVANLISALRDIDGVTRVGLESAARPESVQKSGGRSGGDCRTRDFISQFQLVVAFDAATASAGSSTESEAPPSPPADSAPAEEPPAGEDASETSEGAPVAASASAEPAR